MPNFEELLCRGAPCVNLHTLRDLPSREEARAAPSPALPRNFPNSFLLVLRWLDAEEEAARAAACTRCWAWLATALMPTCATPTASSPWSVTSSVLSASLCPVRLLCFAQRSQLCCSAHWCVIVHVGVGGQKWHPDKCAGSSVGSTNVGKARFRKIQGAYAGNQSASQVATVPNGKLLEIQDYFTYYHLF